MYIIHIGVPYEILSKQFHLRKIQLTQKFYEEYYLRRSGNACIEKCFRFHVLIFIEI